MSYLKPGDKISLVMPSSGSEEVFNEAIPELKNIFAARGYSLVYKNDMAVNGADLFSANTLEYRIQSFIDAVNDPDTSVIWAFRGGYGAGKMLAGLDKDLPDHFTKTLIGFSDITFLHIYLHNRYNTITFHAPTSNKFMDKPMPNAVINEIFAVLEGKQQNIIFNLKVISNPDKLQQIDGITEGGNLEIVRSTIGTKWQVNCHNKILFLEDVNEPAYRYDRMFYQLVNSDAIAGAKAIILGRFTCIDEDPDMEIKLIQGFREYTSIPILSSTEFGHISNNRIIPLNENAKIIFAGDLAQLTIEVAGETEIKSDGLDLA